MPHYFFQLTDQTDTIIDEEGRELDDLAAAMDVALGEARAMISADALTGRISLLPEISIIDERGATLHRLVFADAVAILHGDCA